MSVTRSYVWLRDLNDVAALILLTPWLCNQLTPYPCVHAEEPTEYSVGKLLM